MDWIVEWIRKAWHFLGRGRFDRELEEEMRLHLELRAEELEAGGLAAREARRQAALEFGPRARIQEEVREAWRWNRLETLASDIRYAARALRRNPGYAAAAVFSIALGSAANTTVFNLSLELLFSEPSVRDANSVLTMRASGNSHASKREYEMVRDSGLFDGVAGMRESSVNWRRGGETARLSVVEVTDNYFEVAGIPVWMGRGFRSGGGDEAVLQWSFWHGPLNADPNIIGRTLVLDGRPRTVTGVLPERHRTIFGFGYAPEMYVGATDKDVRLMLVARLPKGVSRGEALERLKSVCSRLDEVNPLPEGARARQAEVTPVAGLGRLSRKMIRTVGAFFAMLVLVSVMVLLVACANVASLQLARAAARRQELAVRSALGAGRGRLIRQLLAESLVLAGLGTACGVSLNLAITHSLDGLALPLPVPVKLLVSPDWRLFTYALFVALMSAVAAGVLPALAATRTGPLEGLKSGERNVSGGRWGVRSLVVAGQLAVTTVLLATAFLFLRNLAQAGVIDAGFDIDRTIWATVRLVPAQYADPQAVSAVREKALGTIRRLPGIESAASMTAVPLNDGLTMGVTVRPDVGGDGRALRIHVNPVTPGYFGTMGIGLAAGRDFNADDRAGSEPVAVLNEEMARQLFGAKPAVGRRIYWTFAGGRSHRLVVGVARNSKYMTLGEENAAAMYEPASQAKRAETAIQIMARTARPVAGVAREMSVALAEIDKSAAVEVRPMRSAMAMAFMPSRVGAGVLGTMGALGVLLASLGLYGVLAYSVSRRVREIGLRVALGARPSQVLWLVAGQSLALLCAGAGAGIALAVLVTQPLAVFLVPGVKPTDAITYGAVLAVLAAVGVLATAAPALRAAGVDPSIALREE